MQDHLVILFQRYDDNQRLAISLRVRGIPLCLVPTKLTNAIAHDAIFATPKGILPGIAEPKSTPTRNVYMPVIKKTINAFVNIFDQNKML